MIRILMIALVAAMVIFLIYLSVKYIKRFFIWLGKNIKRFFIWIWKLNWSYFSRKRIRVRKQLDNVFRKGLLIGKKKVFPKKEINRDFNYDNEGFEPTIVYETKYQIEFPNLSTITISRLTDDKCTKSFITLKSSNIETTEYISNLKARRYVRHFMSKNTSDVENLKRTVKDIIKDSESIQYTEKLKEIENFQKDM